MECTRNESKSPVSKSERRLVRLGMAVGGLSLALGASALVAPAVSSAHTNPGKSTSNPAARLRTQDERLGTIAARMHLGAGSVLAAERSLDGIATSSGQRTGGSQILVTSERQRPGSIGSRTGASKLAETHSLIAIAERHHLGVGEVLAVERSR